MSTLPDVQHSWDKLPDETATAYHRFSIYLELGPDRSLEKVRENIGKTSGYERQLQVWSSKYDWVRRASLYDSYNIRKSLEGRQEIIDEVTGKLLQAASKVADELIMIAMHNGKEEMGEDQISLFNQKFKAIESILDRVGVVKKKDMPDFREGGDAVNFFQQINQTIISQQNNKNGTG